MTHSELIDKGAKYLKKKCSFILREMTCTNSEIADVIGFNSTTTFLIEAKTSRSDFLKDFKKPFRINPEEGVGDFRFYIAPKGLIKQNEIPSLWGLLEVDESGKVEETYNPFGGGNIYSSWNKNPKNKDAEYNLMYSALRRVNKLTKIYI